VRRLTGSAEGDDSRPGWEEGRITERNGNLTRL
jgi:hypothetical protein